MSELINNREKRKETLKNIIRELHQGKTVDEVKLQFEEVFDGVSAAEISEAETALIQEGVSISEIQSLCDVHASVFKGAIEEIHHPAEPDKIPGHPVNIFMKENRVIEQIIEKEIKPYVNKMEEAASYKKVIQGLEALSAIRKHYLRKENLFFPYMEKFGVTAPPKVMWGVDDEIIAQLKIIQSMMKKSSTEVQALEQQILNLTERVEEMIFKEENILLPMLTEKLTEYEWKSIAEESQEFGYLIQEVPVWNPVKEEQEHFKEEHKGETGVVSLPSGSFTIEELATLFNTFPFDITFVDRNDEVKFFSEGQERIFPRTRSVIGRNVSNCHPPASVHVVEEIVADFKSGKKDNESFWIQKGEMFILIQYFAVRNEKKEYLGVLEVTQNVKSIRDLEGEKRLVTD